MVGGISFSNMICHPCLCCSPFCPSSSFTFLTAASNGRGGSDTLAWRAGLFDKGEHDSETVSAAANVTPLSADGCDFWQINAVIPSAVGQVTCPATWRGGWGGGTGCIYKSIQQNRFISTSSTGIRYATVCCEASWVKRCIFYLKATPGGWINYILSSC